MICAGYCTQAQNADWKEMHGFHSVISRAFHLAEKNDLEPLKQKSGELLKRADLWQKSRVPEGYDPAVTKPILDKLVAKCREIDKAVALRKSDQELKRLITQAHGLFHEIMEKCGQGLKHH